VPIKLPSCSLQRVAMAKLCVSVDNCMFTVLGDNAVIVDSGITPEGAF